MKQKILFFLLILTLLAACSTEQAVPQGMPSQPTDVVFQMTTIPVSTPELITEEPTVSVATDLPALPTPDAATWKAWPVIPTLNPAMLDVYVAGQGMGRDPQVVSIVGDCESSSDWFLKDFAKDERFYDLGPYASLQETIDYFNPSLGYQSFAALRGATAVTVLTPLWADGENCQANETPLACEYRVHNPSFAIIALGTNDVYKLDQFEPKMRTVIEYTLDQGIVPILVTKADNVEGDESINHIIAQLSAEYGLPVWNFWAAVQPLPDHGLQDDGVHLTFGSNFFNDPEKLDRAWPVRNLTALQVLEAMRLSVQEK